MGIEVRVVTEDEWPEALRRKEYVKDTEKLQRVAEILARHVEEGKAFYLSHLRCQVKEPAGAKSKLKSMFVVANRQRRGASGQRLRTAAQDFEEALGSEVGKISSLPAKEAHGKFFRWLCSIKGVNQKTAGLFLYWIVRCCDDLRLNEIGIKWDDWLCHLYVPLDTWVLRLLGPDHLNVGTEDFRAHFLRGTVPNMKVQPGRFLEFQKQLKEATTSVGQPPIVLDELWFVGHTFCDYGMLLCDVCWVQDFCLKRDTKTGESGSLSLNMTKPSKVLVIGSDPIVIGQAERNLGESRGLSPLAGVWGCPPDLITPPLQEGEGDKGGEVDGAKGSTTLAEAGRSRP